MVGHAIIYIFLKTVKLRERGGGRGWRGGREVVKKGESREGVGGGNAEGGNEDIEYALLNISNE